MLQLFCTNFHGCMFLLLRLFFLWMGIHCLRKKHFWTYSLTLTFWSLNRNSAISHYVARLRLFRLRIILSNCCQLWIIQSLCFWLTVFTYYPLFIWRCFLSRSFSQRQIQLKLRLWTFHLSFLLVLSHLDIKFIETRKETWTVKVRLCSISILVILG